MLIGFFLYILLCAYLSILPIYCFIHLFATKAHILVFKIPLQCYIQFTNLFTRYRIDFFDEHEFLIFINSNLSMFYMVHTLVY